MARAGRQRRRDAQRVDISHRGIADATGPQSAAHRRWQRLGVTSGDNLADETTAR